jgi:hypothetical protein
MVVMGPEVSTTTTTTTAFVRNTRLKTGAIQHKTLDRSEVVLHGKPTHTRKTRLNH